MTPPYNHVRAKRTVWNLISFTKKPPTADLARGYGDTQGGVGCFWAHFSLPRRVLGFTDHARTFARASRQWASHSRLRSSRDACHDGNVSHTWQRVGSGPDATTVLPRRRIGNGLDIACLLPQRGQDGCGLGVNGSGPRRESGAVVRGTRTDHALSESLHPLVVVGVKQRLVAGDLGT